MQTTYDVEWAKSVLEKTGTPTEYPIRRTKDIYDAAKEGTERHLDLRQARDLVNQLKDWGPARYPLFREVRISPDGTEIAVMYASGQWFAFSVEVLDRSPMWAPGDGWTEFRPA